jgi:hypothetical protein
MADLIILGEIDLKTGQLVLSRFIAEMGREWAARVNASSLGLPGTAGGHWAIHPDASPPSHPSVLLWEIWLPKEVVSLSSRSLREHGRRLLPGWR